MTLRFAACAAALFLLAAGPALAQEAEAPAAKTDGKTNGKAAKPSTPVDIVSNEMEILDKEKKAIMKQWAKREEQTDRVLQATVGMYGDLQGIAGKTLQEIEGLEMKALEPGNPAIANEK